MSQESHYKLLATFHLIAGILGLILIASLRLLFSVIFPLIDDFIHQSEPIAEFFVNFGFQLLRLIGWIALIGIIFPSIIGAIGLILRKSWGIYLLLVSGCLRLVNFPLGTALGIYTLWVHFKYQNQGINE